MNLLFFLVGVRTKEEGILIVNPCPLVYLHLDICLVNSRNAVFNGSPIHVCSQIRCPREETSICVLGQLFASEHYFLNKYFQVPLHFADFFNPLRNQLVYSLDYAVVERLGYSSNLLRKEVFTMGMFTDLFMGLWEGV